MDGAIVFGARFLFPEPDSAVWVAPATVRWFAALAGVPLVVVLALSGRVWRWFDQQVRWLQSQEGADFWAWRKRRAFLHLGYRASAVACGYAAILTVACGIIVWQVRAYTTYPERQFTFIVEPGVSAAAGGLLAPAMALLVASIASLVVGATYGHLLGGTGLFPVIWMLAGVPGCLVGMGFAPTGTHGPWVAAATVLGVLGGLRLVFPVAGGMLLGKLRNVGIQVRAEFAQEAKGESEVEGVYRVESRNRAWLWFQSWFFVPKSVLTDVRWTRDGIEAIWLSGTDTFYPWDQVLSVKVTEFVRGGQGAVVATSSGDQLDIPQGGADYRHLVSAVQAHIWARGKPEDQ